MYELVEEEVDVEEEVEEVEIEEVVEEKKENDKVTNTMKKILDISTEVSLKKKDSEPLEVSTSKKKDSEPSLEVSTLSTLSSSSSSSSSSSLSSSLTSPLVSQLDNQIVEVQKQINNVNKIIRMRAEKQLTMLLQERERLLEKER
jgi:hypothetical protein